MNLSVAESAYHFLPISLQNLAVSIVGSLNERTRYGPGYNSLYHSVLQRFELCQNVMELKRYQASRLSNHLLQASACPYWRQVFRTYGIKPDSSDPFEELAKLPILSKEIVRNRGAEMVNPMFPTRRLIRGLTSGTTGSGMVVYSTQKSVREQWAVWWRYRSFHGIDRSRWCGYFAGRSIVPVSQTNPPFWRWNHPSRQLAFSAYHLRAETAPTYIRALRTAGVTWLHGYPSVLTALGALATELDIEIRNQIEVVTIGAENLQEFQKQVIQNAFEAPVRQHYGLSEGVANISEWTCGGLHVDEDFSFVEFIPCKGINNSYHIVGTNWTNPAFPLLRYDTGDIAQFTNERCRCGSCWRAVQSIDGRKEDYVVLRDGTKLGRLDHIFKKLVNIREAQIHQTSFSTIILRVVPGTNYSAIDEDQMLIEARRRLGESVEITVEYVERIPRTPTGKLRFVISDIAPSSMRGNSDGLQNS